VGGWGGAPPPVEEEEEEEEVAIDMSTCCDMVAHCVF